MIILKNICKKYHEKHVLDNISYTFQPGKLYVIKGVSGSGKTTLLNIISGLDFDYQGEYLWNHQKITRKQQTSIRKQTGYMFQQSLLFSNLSIRDNLLFFCQDVNQILLYAKQFHVEHLLDKMPNTLSGGERQRISLIRTLLLNTNIILVDEATASLDIETSKTIAASIASLKEMNKIVIVATHESCFDVYADETISLCDGRIAVKNKENIKDTMVEFSNIKRKRIPLKYAYLYAKTKVKHTSIVSKLSFLFIFLFLFISAGFLLHSKDAYQQSLFQDIPYQVIICDNQQYQSYDQKESLEELKMYQAEINEILLRNYLPNQYSTLAMDGVIEYGVFPANEDEVLVNMEAMHRLFPNKSVEDVRNQTISFYGNKMKIVGILTNDISLLSTAYQGNPAYDQGFDEATIFLSTSLIQRFESTSYDQKSLYVVKDLLPDHYSNWDHEAIKYAPYRELIVQKLTAVKSAQTMLVFIMLLFMLLGYAYFSNMILMDIYYRKNEFGYLQLFQVPKSSIYMIIFIEYIYKIGSSLGLALLGSYLLFQVIQERYALSIALNGLEYFYMSGIMLCYIFCLVCYPVFHMLKKDIISLIRWDI